MRVVKRTVGACLLACFGMAGAIASAQDNRDRQDQAIAFPTGNRESSVLLIETTAPDSVRAGQQYQYQIRATNITKHLALENVRIQQRTSQGTEIVNIQSERQRQGQQGQQSKQSQEDQAKQKPQGDQQQNGQQQQDRNVWKISRLMPGETATAQVTAVGDNEGTVHTCLSVHYEPAVCLATTYTKPEIGVTKSAPERANACIPIQFRYRIKNVGTGTTKDVTLRDPLPEGVTTVDGKNEAVFSVGSLAPDQSRDFDVYVVTNRSGEIGSRAIAESAGGLKAQSNRPTTQVTAPNLAVEAQGPQVATVGETATYRVTVRNQGDAVAEDARLSIEVPQGFDLVGASRNAAQQDQDQNQAMRTFQLGNLDPGQQQQMWIRTVARQPGKTLGYNFIATSACDRDREERKAERATVRTDVIAIPALLLTTVDKDPVKVGDDATYTITVVNQGSAPAKNVQVTATLPEELKFEKASGATAAQADGNKITFKPMDTLAPNDRLQWHITAKATKPGQVRLHTELTSDELRQPGVSMEPTTLFGPEAKGEQEQTATRPDAPDKKSR